MSMKNLQKAKSLLDNGEKLKTLESEYKESIKNSSTDKYGFCFKSIARTSVFSSNVSLEAYTGQYGDSSVYTYGGFNLNSEDAQKAFLGALNKHRDLILQTMGDMAKAEAFKLKDAAQAEIEASQKIVDSLCEVSE